MAFVAFGFCLGPHGLGILDLGVGHGGIHFLAELTLVVVLFTDASRIDLKLLRRDHDIPVRLLTLGLPLTVVLGAGLATLLLPQFNFWECALLAAVLAPTDAALGQAVVSSPKLPVRIRQSLNVESGLNDGIALPGVLILLSVACALGNPGDVGYWVQFTAKQVILGPLVGIAVGYLGGKLLESGNRRGWINVSFLNLSALALALIAFAGAELVHGNGFIAAFTAGLAFGNFSRAVCEVHTFAEAEGQLLSLLIFLIFGAVMVPEALELATFPILLYSLLSLTVIRMLPVTLSLLGSRLRPGTVLFLGWFGPRGIASILFGLLIVQNSSLPNHEGLVPIVTLTVLLSIFGHGITANPLADLYARQTETMDPEASPEHLPVSEMPLRLPSRKE